MLVLDTFNILHTVGVLPPDLAGLDVQGVAALIERSRYRQQRTIFACDGLPAADLPPPGPLDVGENPASSFEVRYSGRIATADDDIRTLVDASSAPRRMIVVSSDHEVIRHARKRRCTALTSEEFLQHLADDADLPRPTATEPRRPSAMSEDQVRKWIDVFDVDEQALHDEVRAHTETGDATELPEPPASIDPERRIDASKSDLPMNLIEEAESMWRRESTPMRAPTSSTPLGESTENPSETNRAHESSAGDDDVLDMNTILPNDGHTRPLRRRDNRHRSAD